MADAEPELKNKPEDSDFKQQRLKAWQPILTPFWVILTFASVGIVFLIVGILVLMASDDVVEFQSAEYQALGGASCVQGNASTPSSCLVDFSAAITKDMKAPIYVYYHLTNFYQNHRRYVKSRSDIQLRGDGDYDVDSTCAPLDTRSCTKSGGTTGTCAVYPCGLIAWSVFNDTFYSHTPSSFTAPSNSDIIGSGSCTEPTSCLKITRAGANKYIPWTSQGIAWASDREQKFKVTSSPTPVDSTACSGTPTASTCMAMPYDSYKYFKCTDPSVTGNNNQSCPLGKRYADVSNEEFIVWMRTSGLPIFRKLHRIINTDLKAGDEVNFKVNNVFPVSAFSGTKKVVLSTTTWIGGKNQFLGIAYIVVAVICLLLALGFAVKQAFNPREPTSELEKSLASED